MSRPTRIYAVQLHDDGVTRIDVTRPVSTDGLALTPQPTQARPKAELAEARWNRAERALYLLVSAALVLWILGAIARAVWP